MVLLVQRAAQVCNPLVHRHARSRDRGRAVCFVEEGDEVRVEEERQPHLFTASTFEEEVPGRRVNERLRQLAARSWRCAIPTVEIQNGKYVG